MREIRVFNTKERLFICFIFLHFISGKHSQPMSFPYRGQKTIKKRASSGETRKQWSQTKVGIKSSDSTIKGTYKHNDCLVIALRCDKARGEKHFEEAINDTRPREYNSQINKCTTKDDWSQHPCHAYTTPSLLFPHQLNWKPWVHTFDPNRAWRKRTRRKWVKLKSNKPAEALTIFLNIFLYHGWNRFSREMLSLRFIIDMYMYMVILFLRYINIRENIKIIKKQKQKTPHLFLQQ